MSAINVFNRVLVVMVGLALAVAGAVCLLVVTGTIEPGTLAISGWFREQFDHLDGLSGNNDTLAIVVSAAAIGAGISLAMIEVLPQGRGSRRALAVGDPNGNVVSLPPESLQMIVEQAAMEVPGVIRAKAAVDQVDGGAIVVLNAILEPTVHIVDKTSELNDRVRSEIQNRVGVKLAKLRMNLELARVDSADARRRDGVRPVETREEIAAPR